MKTIKRSDGRKPRAAAMVAQETLRSIHFFSNLRGALRSLGLAGSEERMGVGAYLAATSRFQEYPLRVQILERTEGTARHIFRKVGKILPPDCMGTISPTPDKEWDRLAEALNEKFVFIPEWEAATKNGVARLDVAGDRIVRAIPEKSDGRVVKQFDEIEGRFACISGGRPWELGQHPRWLTMVQPEREKAEPGLAPPLNVQEWIEVQRLLKDRARLPIHLPEWEQLVVEHMAERDDRALKYVPALIQAWRTMCLIRSFQDEKNDGAKVLLATFEDLAAATLLAKKVFREGCWFPSSQKLLAKLPKLQDGTSVINPVTGKPVIYRRREKDDPAQYRLLFENVLTGVY
jgi:hypothetical protein